MLCWYCYWGWPEAVAVIYNKYLAELGWNPDPLEYGPGHVVWSDENWDCVDFCLDEIAANRSFYNSLTDEEIDAVRRSLEELKALPEAAFDGIPDDYDGEHPERHPPVAPVVKVH